ncbi:uncharacterized protein PG986_014054 [Apiospora aurea]|uniref:Indole-diterpene biosynthesis protein PaxU n=1 Tax=Apiospora aurea TaxID=335848 RepID=A0ABR1PRW3_9PEZI
MALPGFVQLGPNILLYTPSEHQVGQLIILCTWMGAADKHIAKYADIYRQKAPGAKILLLKSVVGSMISSYASQRRAMRPAQQAVCQLLQEHYSLQRGGESFSEEPRILLHMMSNGGANSATNLLVDLKARLKAPLPMAGLICDSTPNASSWKKTCHAFMYSFPCGFPINLFTTAFVYATITLLYAWIALGNEAPEDYWRRSVLDEKLIRCRKVCYVASKIDKMTDWRDVVSHAAEARKMGWKTKEIIVDDTPHCNHISKHEEVYVNAVSDVWEGREI